MDPVTISAWAIVAICLAMLIALLKLILKDS